MKKTFKSILSIVLVLTLLAAFCINTFAATASYKKIASYASEELVDVTCNYYSIKKDNFTVKNNGTIDVFVYVNGAYRDRLSPGESYTQPKSHAFKHRVQIYAVSGAVGRYQKIAISSTSGVIYNN